MVGLWRVSSAVARLHCEESRGQIRWLRSDAVHSGQRCVSHTSFLLSSVSCKGGRGRPDANWVHRLRADRPSGSFLPTASRPPYAYGGGRPCHVMRHDGGCSGLTNGIYRHFHDGKSHKNATRRPEEKIAEITQKRHKESGRAKQERNDPCSSLTHISSSTGSPRMVDVCTKSRTVRTAEAEARVLLSRRVYVHLTPDGKRSEDRVRPCGRDGGEGDPQIPSHLVSPRKGDVFKVAELAGIMAAKKTSDLIPLCHNISLSSVEVCCSLEEDTLSVSSFERDPQDQHEGSDTSAEYRVDNSVRTPKRLHTSVVGDKEGARLVFSEEKDKMEKDSSDKGEKEKKSLLHLTKEVDEDLQPVAVVVRSRVKCVGETGVEMEALTAVSVASLTVYDMCKSIDKNIRITDLRLLSKTGGSQTRVDLSQGHQRTSY